MANGKNGAAIELRSPRTSVLSVRSGYPIFVLGAVAAFAACGSADEHPLGGPYGGSGATTAPTKGNPSTFNSVVDSGAADPGATTDPTSSAGGTTGGGGTAGGGSTSAGGGTTGGGTSPGGGNTGGGGTAGGGSATAGGGTTGGTVPAPTWTKIVNSYLKDGTHGECGPSCHSQFSSPSAAYTWMQRKGQISGTTSRISSASTSCLSWYGGNMPPKGPMSLSQAKIDIKAWVAAGALNN